MTTGTEAPEAINHPFLRELVTQFRALDAHGAWDRKSDEQLLEPFIVDKAKRREIPIMGDPEPEVLERLELFYNALGLAIEKRCGHMASPIMAMHHEGFGRVVLTTGRLVVVSRHLRDVHRFGFDSLGELAREGEKMIDAAVALINKYPEVARL
jgi:probable nitrogen fixation protein